MLRKSLLVAAAAVAFVVGGASASQALSIHGPKVVCHYHYDVFGRVYKHCKYVPAHIHLFGHGHGHGHRHHHHHHHHR